MSFLSSEGSSINKNNASIASYNKMDILKASVTFTRPNNTDAYIAGDSISSSVTATPTTINISEIVNANGKAFRISKVIVKTSHTSIPAMNVWISKAAMSVVDNAPLDMLDAETNDILTVIPLLDRFDTASNSMIMASNLGDDCICDGGSDTIWLLLETLEAYTPAALSTFRIEIYYSQLN